MRFRFDIGGRVWQFDGDRRFDLSIPLQFDGPQPNAFFLPTAQSESFRAGGFVGDTRQGGGCNCRTVTLNPHGNGTHTEGLGHIADAPLAVAEILRDTFIPAVLVTVTPTSSDDPQEGLLAGGDRAVTRPLLQQAFQALGDIPAEFFRGVLVRTVPNDASKRTAHYSGANPPYLSPGAAALLRERGTEHLLLDLPSADPEDDGGALKAHRIFWGVPQETHQFAEPIPGRTITEMIYAPDHVPDGLYLLNLQIPAFLLDAAPSRPLVFPIESVE